MRDPAPIGFLNYDPSHDQRTGDPPEERTVPEAADREFGQMTLRHALGNEPGIPRTRDADARVEPRQDPVSG
jgi:hypothetical protein